MGSGDEQQEEKVPSFETSTREDQPSPHSPVIYADKNIRRSSLQSRPSGSHTLRIDGERNYQQPTPESIRSRASVRKKKSGFDLETSVRNISTKEAKTICRGCSPARLHWIPKTHIQHMGSTSIIRNGSRIKIGLDFQKNFQ